jgi:uncharacterized protein YuzE
MFRFEFEGMKDVFISYDPDARAAYIKVRAGRVAKTKERATGLNVDLGADGQLLGFEVIDPKNIKLTVIQRIAKEFNVPALEHFNPRVLPRMFACA